MALGGPDGVLNAGGWRSGPKDSKNIYHLGSVWIVPEIWFWGFGGPWGAMGVRDDNVMVQVVIYM